MQHHGVQENTAFKSGLCHRVGVWLGKSPNLEQRVLLYEVRDLVPSEAPATPRFWGPLNLRGGRKEFHEEAPGG